MSESSAVKKYVAEMIGTLVLVLMGCGSAVIAGRNFGGLAGLAGIGAVGISFAFGLSVLAMAYAIGGISGCHINPAISISMFAAGKIKLKNMIIYVVVQCIGAVIAAALIYGIASRSPGIGLDVTNLGQNGYDAAFPGGFSMAFGFQSEVVFHFIFFL